MATTLLEAAKRSSNRLFQGIALGIVTTDELAAVLPFQSFQGQAMDYMREQALPDTDFIPDDGTMGSASEATFDRVTVPLRNIASDMDVLALADDLSQRGERGAQLMQKTKATWRKVKSTFITGGNVTSHTLGSTADPFAAITAMAYGPWLDSGRFGPGSLRYDDSAGTWEFRAPGDPSYGEPVVAAADGTFLLRSFNQSKWIRVTLDVSLATTDGETHIRFASSNNEFDGINRMCASSQVVSSSGTDGDAFSFDVLDHLIDIVKVRENRAFFCNGQIVRKYMAALRTLNTSPDHTKLPGYNGEVLMYRGIPILENDNIPSTEAKGSATTLSSIYLASLSAEEGLFMGYPSPGAGSPVDVDGDPRSRPVMGFRIEEIGLRESVDTRRTRVKWYGAAGLRSELALARASEIITA